MSTRNELVITVRSNRRLGVAKKEVEAAHELAIHAYQSGERAKQQFLSVMSHELRTPLNGIIGIADLLSQNGETQALRDQTKIILQSGHNLLDLLTGIMNMAQMEAGSLKIYTAPTDIHTLVDGIYQDYKSRTDCANIIFTCHIAHDVPNDLMIDSIRLKEAIIHLVSNAVKFTAQGRIHIHITAGETAEENSVQTLSIIVADTGMGIEKHIQEKLFMPFVQADSSMTRAHDGAGIGLAVTRGLARLMGGDVTMKSTAGRGSEFMLTIKTCSALHAELDLETGQPTYEVEPNPEQAVSFAPAVTLEELQANDPIQDVPRRPQYLAPSVNQSPEEIAQRNMIAPEPNEQIPADLSVGIFEQAPQQFDILEDPAHRGVFSRRKPRPSEGAVSSDQLRGLNILIVEDIIANQEVLCSLLEPVGCTVSSAAHGGEALDLMKAQIFDVVLMDIRMPIMDGVEATETIRKTPGPHQNVPIIALTADASAENNAQCLAAGADVFLTKPVIVSELFASIRFVREKKNNQEQNARTA